MHLTESDISLLFNNLYNKLNDKGVLILSYNDLDRSEDKDRLFFKITKSLINELAAKNNFILEKTEIMIDKRDINWITEKYVKDLKWEK